MADKFTPVEQYDVTDVDKVQATDRVLYSFYNGYFQKFINTFAYLKAKLDEKSWYSTCTLLANGWSGSSAPYTQSVTPTFSVSGRSYTGSDLERPHLVKVNSSIASAEDNDKYEEAYSAISSGKAKTETNGKVTFYVYDLPQYDITVGLEGI